MNWSDILEQAIIGKVIAALIEDGYRLEISDQDGGGLFIYAAPDGGEIEQQREKSAKYQHWVKLVFGNGPDVIVDYTINLETTLKPVDDFTAQWRD